MSTLEVIKARRIVLTLSEEEGQALADLLACNTTSALRDKLKLTEVTNQLADEFPDNAHVLHGMLDVTRE